MMTPLPTFPATALTCAVIASTALAACGDDGGADGMLVVIASGEDAAQGGYPVGEGDTAIAFSDGWTLQFDHVVVSLADFTLGTADGDTAAVDADPVVADLTLGEPELWSFGQVPAKRWDRVGFRYAPAANESREANDVDDDVLEAMIDGGYSLLIAATAEKDGRQVAVEYGFDFEVEMSHCVSGLDETDGLVVPAGGVAEAQVTVHLDHLFFDSFAIDDAALRFDAMAAMAPDDGPLTLADLAGQDNLSDLVDDDGDPLDLAYDPGSTFDPVPENLRDYVIGAATTTGHFNGEGHCHYERTDN